MRIVTVRLNIHSNGIILLAASSLLFPQSEHPPLALDVSKIVQQSVAATQRSWQDLVQYTCTERDENRRLDSDGRVNSNQVEVSRVILVDGVPFEQLVERNGRPPSPDDERKQNERLNRLKRETPEQRADRICKQQEETSFFQDVPGAFDFQLLGEEKVNTRPAYVLQATPHPGYQPHSKYGKMFAKVEGRLWVDKEDFGWIKADGHVIEPFSVGLFLVRVLRGSHITIEETHIDDRTWLPQQIEVQATARIFLVRSLMIDRVLSFSDYKRAQPR